MCVHVCATREASIDRCKYTIYIAVSLNSVHGEVYSIQHYVIKFVNDLSEILLKVALNTINQPTKLRNVMKY
jgi:hypothetical protein